MADGYICTGGCKGFSTDAVNCGTDECSLKGQPLVAGSKCDKCSMVSASGTEHTC